MWLTPNSLVHGPKPHDDAQVKATRYTAHVARHTLHVTRHTLHVKQRDEMLKLWVKDNGEGEGGAPPWRVVQQLQQV